MDAWKMVSPIFLVAGAVLVNRCRSQDQPSVSLLLITHLAILIALLGSIFPTLLDSQFWAVMTWIAIGFAITFFGTMLLVTVRISVWVWVGLAVVLLLIPTIREEMIRLLGGAAMMGILLWLGAKLLDLRNPAVLAPEENFEDVSEDWFNQAGLEAEFEIPT